MLRKFLFLVLILGGLSFLANSGQICNAAKEVATDRTTLMPVAAKVAGGSRFDGDINGDGVMDPADMVYFLRYFWRSGSPPPNMDDADLNNDGSVDILDMVLLLDWLWYYTW